MRIVHLLARGLLAGDLLDQRRRQQPTHQPDGVELEGGGTTVRHQASSQARSVNK